MRNSLQVCRRCNNYLNISNSGGGSVDRQRMTIHTAFFMFVEIPVGQLSVVRLDKTAAGEKEMKHYGYKNV